MRSSIKIQFFFVFFLAFFLCNLIHAEDITEKIDKIFERFNSTRIPGVAVAVIQGDDIVFKKAYGMASLELSVPNTAKTVFRVGSVSKQFTAACVAMLSMEKKINLSDSITKFLPELPEDVYGAVTVKHMIHHTSGIRDSEALYPFMGIEYSQWYTHDMLLKMLARQRGLSFTPGKMLEYSNSAYTLLALIVQRVTNKPFHTFAKEHIFDPLGMKNTYIQTRYDTFIPNRAAGYAPGSDGYRNWMTNNQLIGHDALYSSVEDLARWAGAFYNGKLDQKLVEMMTTPDKFNDGSLNSYAYGMVIGHYKGLKTYQHSGWYVGYTAYLIIFPEQKFSVICLSNNVQGSRSKECLDIAEIYLADQIAESLQKLRKSAKEVNKDLLGRLAGDYLGENYGGAFALEVKDGKPQPKGANWTYEFSPFNENEFINYNRRLVMRVVSGAKGGDIVIEILTPMGRIDRFWKIKETVKQEDFSPFLGEYWSDEIQAAAYITEKEGKMKVKISLKEGWMTQIEPDLFRTMREKLEFHRDKAGEIRGFQLSTYGFQHVSFEKK